MKNNSRKKRSPEIHRSTCPIASALDLVGDKWTLIVVRDLFLGKHRYGEFQASPEAIPSNILAERLKRLEAAGLVVKEYYQENPPRAEYFLTQRGADLAPILRTMREWGKKHIAGTFVPEQFAKLPAPEIRS